MSIAKYEAFIKTVEEGSLTKAAESLGYTQSGMSHLIRSLEEEMGATLLLRERSGARLTPEGAALLPFFRNICNGQRELLDKANQLHGLESGLIRIGTFSSISCHWLPAWIQSFQGQHPNIEFQLLHGDYTEIEDWLVEGRVDLGFLRLPALANVVATTLKQDRLLVILPETHPLAEVDTFPVERLAEEPFILLEEGKDNEIHRIFEALHLTPQVIFEVSDDYTIMAMVESGLGISILPELVLYRNSYHIVMKELSVPFYRRLGVAVKQQGQEPLAARRFLEHILRAIPKL